MALPTMNVTPGSGATVNTLPNAPAVTADSVSFAIATDDVMIGSRTETAPASDTASSGLNGRLQRLAQRLTALVALFPASLGQKASAASMAVVVASDQSAVPISASVLPLPAGAATATKQDSTIAAVQAPKTGVAPVVSSALASSLVLKSSAGSLCDLDVAITDTSGWVMLFDGTSAPGDGAVTPKKFYPVDSNGTNGALYKRFDPPLLFSTGIVAVFSSTGPFSKTAVAKAAFSGQVI